MPVAARTSSGVNRMISLTASTDVGALLQIPFVLVTGRRVSTVSSRIPVGGLEGEALGAREGSRVDIKEG